mmetsp:Transcript_84855/g.218598  ORF Transcript_84855/g.218598 Transcript_84855/m.218598 type:complete len:146 (+) Transcript_84855:79-516(+)
MSSVTTAAKAILEHRAPYLGGLIGVKVLTLGAVFLLDPASSLALALVALCIGASLTDVALRIAASRSHAFALSKHGSDVLLAFVLILDAMSCSDEDGGTSKLCKAMRMVVPFALLVSVGGNSMRLTSSPRGLPPPEPCEEDDFRE